MLLTMNARFAAASRALWRMWDQLKHGEKQEAGGEREREN